MLKKILSFAVVAIVLICALASTKPDNFRVSRTVSMKAPADTVFSYINDLQKWQQWSPWEKLDPAIKRSYGGPQAGKGAAYAWSGNDKVGVGQMEIVESVQPSRIVFKLDLEKPFEAHHATEFLIQPQGGGQAQPVGDMTNVTWTMTGKSPFFVKVMRLFFDCDKMIGKDFETGLNNLKAVVEK